jgi:hypothetical protein
MKLAGIVATLLLGIAGPATAADFYAFEAIEEDSIVLIEPGKIQVMDDGLQVVSLHTVTVDDWGPGAPGPFASLDTTTVEMDCVMPRWRVISESLYLSLNPSGEMIDETNVNSRDWHALRPGGIHAKYHTFVCQWPASSQQSRVMAFPDIWAAATAIADVLQQQTNH